MKVTLYHNPRCSKSREALKNLQELGKDVEVIEYLKTPPTKSEIQDLQKKLGVASLRDMMRTKEEIYKTLDLANADENTLLSAMLEHPVLLERPLAVYGQKAAIGRPWDNIQAII